MLVTADQLRRADLTLEVALGERQPRPLRDLLRRQRADVVVEALDRDAPLLVVERREQPGERVQRVRRDAAVHPRVEVGRRRLEPQLAGPPCRGARVEMEGDAVGEAAPSRR